MASIKSPAKMAFLIVDDADNMRRSIRAMLKLIRFGNEFHEADNGRAAWEFLKKAKQPVDFIIADWNMPYMTGTELLHHVRATPKLRDIPFLMITAEANQEVVAEAAEHDVDAYLTKPFVTASLEQKITELLKQAANPTPMALHLKKARELEEEGDIDQAIVEAKKALAINTQSSRPFREIGRLSIKKGDLKNALSCFQKAVEINRLDVTSYHYLGQIFHRLGKIDKATEFFSKAMTISPRHSDRALNYARLLLKQKILSEAEKVFRLVLRTNSGDLDLKEDIANTCRENGLGELAAKTYREVLKDDPERTYLHKSLGLALLEAGETSEAVEVMEKAVEKSGDDVEILLALAKAYFDMRMSMRADKWATRVIRIDPTNREAKEILNKCL
ncbi:MAG: response regulator [Desulfobacteraceae bacterium]|nr:response regulator [Desulfobacteraceae bacterium]